MSKPLSILMTIFLLVVPSLLTDRCTPETPTVQPCTWVGAAGPSVPAGSAGQEIPPFERGQGRSVWSGPARWVFVAQGLVVSIVNRVVLGSAWETK
jgi:hypothetical protein